MGKNTALKNGYPQHQRTIGQGDKGELPPRQKQKSVLQGRKRIGGASARTAKKGQKMATTDS